MGKVCQICGLPSGIYPLCKKHLEDKAKGLVVKNPETGIWEEDLDIFPSIDKIISATKTNCIICGEETTKGYSLCTDCYYDVEDRKEELDKNQKPSKLRDYYYNAKDYAMRVYDEDKIYYQKLTMVAINNLLKQLHNDRTVEERLTKDLSSIDTNLKNKNDKLMSNIKEKSRIDIIKEEQDKEKAKIKKSQDGHFVESELEITVDDILYNLGIVHAYNIKVDEIIERTVVCDWYIPVSLGKGIYVELWGMVGNEKYNKNKKEKINLYEKYKLPLIEINYSEVKNDTQRLISLIKSKYKQLKIEINESL